MTPLRALILACLCTLPAACAPQLPPGRPILSASPTLTRLPKIKPYVAQVEDLSGSFTYETSYKDPRLQGRLYWSGGAVVFRGHRIGTGTGADDPYKDQLVATFAANVRLITSCKPGVLLISDDQKVEPVLIITELHCPPPVKAQSKG